MAFRSAGSFPSSLTNWPFAARSWSRKVALVLVVGAAGVVLSAVPCRAQAGDVHGAGAARSAADHADRNKPMPYKNSVPAETTVAEDEGPAGSAVIEGQISLRRDGAEQQALELLEKRLRDPGDALYHQWLSPKEMGESFPRRRASLRHSRRG